LEGSRPIPGLIINREVIYESDGGFVVKVVYKEFDQVKTAYYSVSKVEGIEQALDDLSSYVPIVENRPLSSSATEPTTTTLKPSSQQGGKKKSFIDTLFGKKKLN
jgi:hypothetical protein